MPSDSVLLDTHVWYRYLVTPDLLRPRALEVIDTAAAKNAVFVSVISVWELAMLERDGRLELHGGSLLWAEQALSLPGTHLLPLSPAIAVESVHLPSPMHKDPADRVLVASARVQRLTLVTADKAILQFARASGLAHVRA